MEEVFKGLGGMEEKVEHVVAEEERIWLERQTGRMMIC